MLLLVSTLCCLATSFAASTPPCGTQGLEQVALLNRGIAYLTAQAAVRDAACHEGAEHGAPAPAPLPLTLRVSVTTTAAAASGGVLFVGYADGTQAISFGEDASQPPTVQSIGRVPKPCAVPSSAWVFAQHAVNWIAADVSFDASTQRRLLVPDAHCFGAVGRSSVVAGNMALAKTVAFAVPHSIQLDIKNNMVVWDFDVKDRSSDNCRTTGRGTDFVRTRQCVCVCVLCERCGVLNRWLCDRE